MQQMVKIVQIWRKVIQPEQNAMSVTWKNLAGKMFKGLLIYN
jgi:hypothetical protein